MEFLFDLVSPYLENHPVLAVFLALFFLFVFLWFRGRRILAEKKPGLAHLSEKVRSDQQINAALDSLLIKFHCDRAFVYQYHNGQQNTAGIHFDKVSMTHERVMVGVASHLMQMQNIPNSLFAGFNLPILADKECFFPDVTELQGTDQGLYQTLCAQNVRSLYLVGIFGFKHEPVGIVGVSCVDTQRPLSQEQQKQLRAVALKICGMILAGGGEA